LSTFQQNKNSPNSSHKASLLSVRGLWWLVQEQTILDNINFDIYAGEFIGLIGPNGAGKSSL